MGLVEEFPSGPAVALKIATEHLQRVLFEVALEDIWRHTHRIPPVQHVAFFRRVVGEHAVAPKVDPAITLLLVIVRKDKTIHGHAVVAAANSCAALRVPGTRRDYFLTDPAAGKGGEFAVGFSGLGHFHNRNSVAAMG